MCNLFAFGRIGMQQVWPPLGDVGDAEMERLLLAFFLDGHLPLRSTRHIHGLLRMACAINVGYAVLGSEFWFLVAMLVIGHLSVKALDATPFG